MSTAAMIGLGLLAWVPLTVMLAFFLGQMIRLRDQRRVRASRRHSDRVNT
jgi:hypothetical protein